MCRFNHELYVGLDEAGRGSCIGPLVVAMVAIDEEGLSTLKIIGVKDSKKLTAKKRLELFPNIIMLSRYVAVRAIQPCEIDVNNINHLTMKAMHSLLMPLAKCSLIKRVIADYVSPAERLQRLMKGLLPPNVEVLILKDADATYPECMAASIVAKVVRDSELHKLQLRYGVRGSGYSSDPETLSWLKDALSQGWLPPCVRRSWRTIRKLSSTTSLDSWVE
ncbi:MAG: ribonuclease HII [Candidatus Nezhaarchaeales archaeon]|nr:MAG: ribonuclease HII [Candidatus Nezhaarchaeota archaeon WYZ-LMO8]TDA37399.1 MAG: ribonuclease HII [Candidatus Nezhaarchaeota archaeon WYZ-LMO7]